MLWVWWSVCSAFLLGLYDVAKKQALKRNGVLWVLLAATAMSAALTSPFLSAGPLTDHLRLVLKAALVATSWISGLQGLRLLPLTTVSTIKASRPVFVVVFSIILFGERLNLLQWVGVLTVFAALWLLSRSSRKEGIRFKSSKGVLWMALSVVTGAASALYDKHILAGMQPLFVQSWTNLYITALLALCALVQYLRGPSEAPRFRWDWTLLLIAVLITASDALYFFSVKQSDALLSVISMIRRGSAVVTFCLGAWIFKEHNIRDKAVSLAVLLAGIVALMVGSGI